MTLTEVESFFSRMESDLYPTAGDSEKLLEVVSTIEKILERGSRSKVLYDATITTLDRIDTAWVKIPHSTRIKLMGDAANVVSQGT